MFKYRSLLIFLLVGYLSHGQANPCREYSIYEKAFDVFLEASKDTIAIEIRNDFSEIKMTDIKAITDFTNDEIDLIRTKLSHNWDYHSCIKISNLLSKIQKRSPLSKDKTYTLRYYSQPVFLNVNKAILFLSFAVKSKVYVGGKAFGNDILEIYERIDGIWKRTSRETLSVY